MPKPQLANVIMEDRKLAFRNFSGEEGLYNAKGQRNFCVILTEDEAERMKSDGWNIRHLKPREEGDLPTPILKVNVKFDGRRPPKIVLVTTRGKTEIDESMVMLLDWAVIIKSDMIFRPYVRENPDKTTVSAWLQSLYVTIHEDELELKYADVPDSAQNSLIVPDQEGAPF